MQLQNPLDVILPFHHVDIALLAHAYLVAHGSDARWLPAGEGAEREVVETTVRKAEAFICGSAGSGCGEDCDRHFAPATLPTKRLFDSEERHFVTTPDLMPESSAIRGVGTISWLREPVSTWG